MGNSMGCCTYEESMGSFRSSANPLYVKGSASRGPRKPSSSTSKKQNQSLEEFLIRQQALTSLFQQQQQHKRYSHQFNKSPSVQHPPFLPLNKGRNYARSASSRPHSPSDDLIQPHQLVNQHPKIDDLESKHFVLVHGCGFGAWCWYKTMTLLKEAGFQVDAVDLTGSGIHSLDTNSTTSLTEYIKPLTDFLERLGNDKKVILVGHNFGGACVSYAMELYPSKVAKAIFISAAMLTNGQSTLDMLSELPGLYDLMKGAGLYLYTKGKDHPPTAIDFGNPLLAEFMFNKTQAKDVALASVSMKPVPLAPLTQKLPLSKENYGSVPRFYIKTQEDFVIPVSLQEAMISSDPPEQVFQLKSDHSPFFSRPQSLHRLLVEISKVPAKQA